MAKHWPARGSPYAHPAAWNIGCPPQLQPQSTRQHTQHVQLSPEDASREDSGLGDYEAVATQVVAKFHEQRMAHMANRMSPQAAPGLDPSVQVQLEMLRTQKSMQ